MPFQQKNKYQGILLALAAVIIWSGNFIVSRGVSGLIGPVSLAFFRWITATLLIFPLAWKQLRTEWPAARRNFRHLAWVSLTGIALFNTCVYVAGHYTSAINLALIGTTSSPIFATLIAVIFLRDRPNLFRIGGILCCVAGILLLLSRGSWAVLAGFRFSTGDLWILAAALAFAVYSILVRNRPAGISPIPFLFLVFAMGVLMLLPAFVVECSIGAPVQWSNGLIWVILYLGAGASVAAFLCWNISIQKLGATSTVLFGNLIPLFSTIEAVCLLDEKVTFIHLLSFILVISGLVLANTQKKRLTLTLQP